MSYLVAAVVVLAVLVLIDLVLTLGVVRRLREHATLLAAGPRGPAVLQVMRPAGELVDDVKATTVDGDVVSMPPLDGPVVVGFFSRECRTCTERLPEFLAFAAGLPAGTARPVVVAVGDDPADLVEAARPVARVVTEPIDGPVSTAFGVTALPALCVLGPTGRILASGPEMSVLASYVAA